MKSYFKISRDTTTNQQYNNKPGSFEQQNGCYCVHCTAVYGGQGRQWMQWHHPQGSVFGRICTCFGGAVERPPVSSTLLNTATQTIEAFIHLPQTTLHILSLLAIYSLYQLAIFVGFDHTPTFKRQSWCNERVRNN